MKRERSAVWNDEEDHLVNERLKQTQVYGRKPLKDAHSTNLRAEFEYVPDIVP
jgi:hypothetical protein